MTEKEIADSIITTAQTARDAYTLKDLARDFPQIINRNSVIKKANLKKKYTLREAMRVLSNTVTCVKSTKDMGDDLEIRFFTKSGTLLMNGDAAHYFSTYLDDVWLDVIEAGWHFVVIGCEK